MECPLYERSLVVTCKIFNKSFYATYEKLWVVRNYYYSTILNDSFKNISIIRGVVCLVGCCWCLPLEASGDALSEPAIFERKLLFHFMYVAVPKVIYELYSGVH